MTDYEGYLLLFQHIKPNKQSLKSTEPMYFTLSHGTLQYYSKDGGKWIGEIKLSKRKLRVRYRPHVSGPYKFFLSTERSPSIMENGDDCYENNASYECLELGASSDQVRSQWARAISSWRRTNWKNPVIISSQLNEKEALEELIKVQSITSAHKNSISRLWSKLKKSESNNSDAINVIEFNEIDKEEVASKVFNNCISFHSFQKKQGNQEVEQPSDEISISNLLSK